ncbi:hypothetical protein BDZ97DRAFT_1761575 [Flammula alnicola]|nr:hypothetical protein BDZ97DRAFT_1761575 [Flammula alnicola]
MTSSRDDVCMVTGAFLHGGGGWQFRGTFESISTLVKDRLELQISIETSEYQLRDIPVCAYMVEAMRKGKVGWGTAVSWLTMLAGIDEDAKWRWHMGGDLVENDQSREYGSQTRFETYLVAIERVKGEKRGRKEKSGGKRQVEFERLNSQG